MRIDKTRSTSGSSRSSKAGASGDRAAFSSALSGGSGAPVAASQNTMATAGLSSVAALMALQGVDDVLEKRKRVARRGRQMLEGLDRLKLDMLEGRDPSETLVKLKSALVTAREESGETQLETLMDQIELRVEVELAKRESVKQF